MKKIIIYLSLIIGLFLFIPNNVYANNPVKLYMFTLNTCDHCKEAKRYLSDIKYKYPDLEIIEYEVSDQNNYNLLIKTMDLLDIKEKGTPLIVIGSKYTVGYTSSMGLILEQNILQARYNNVRDVIGEIEGTSTYFEENIKENDFVIDIPVLKESKVNNINMLLTSFVLGFSSCNPYLLLSLIFLLCFLSIIKNNKKKRYFLGIYIGTISLLLLALIASYNSILFTSSFIIYLLIISLLLMGIYYVIYEYKNIDISNTIKFVKEKKFSIFTIILSLLGVITSFIINSKFNNNLLLLGRIFVLKDISNIMTYLYGIIYLIGLFFLPIIISIILNYLIKKKIINKYISLIIMILCIICICILLI